MFVREKRINGYTYLYLVETVREDGRAKQRIIKNLGRKDAVVASGGLERLAGSIALFLLLGENTTVLLVIVGTVLIGVLIALVVAPATAVIMYAAK